MIFGVGTDIVELARVQATYDRFGEHFVRRILMPQEVELFRRSKHPARFLAMRFAAKEAIMKALGTGLAGGLSWQHMQLDRQPALRLKVFVQIPNAQHRFAGALGNRLVSGLDHGTGPYGGLDWSLSD